MGDPRCPRLASRVFSVLELQKTEECRGFVLSPAFWSNGRRVRRTRIQHGMNGAALPCRRGFVPSANSMKGRPHFLCSSSPIPMRSHAVYHFHITTGGIDDESM
ncbi:unnamed protein product [Penicillium salamii]|nr:unnamed protein product [Penicillium salamii]CAG8318901.1 unnamed protein product [Penicillium salamii]CAG8906706.1 unnamed protein product [Penicillium salamii]